MNTGQTKDSDEIRSDWEGSRPRVIYVESTRMRGTYHHRSFFKELSVRYDVVQEYDFSEEIVDKILEQHRKKPFYAIVTHVPPRGRPLSYVQSVSALARLKKHVHVPVVAYSGAGPGDPNGLSTEVDGYVDKGKDPFEESARVCQAVEWTWERMKDLERRPPTVTVDNGRTLVTGWARHNDHLGLWGLIAIWQYCRDYPEKVTMMLIVGETAKSRQEVTDHSILDIMSVFSDNADAVRFAIEGQDDAAKSLAKKLVEVLSARSECEVPKIDIARERKR
jgi:hypothetical protein